MSRTCSDCGWDMFEYGSLPIYRAMYRATLTQKHNYISGERCPSDLPLGRAVPPIALHLELRSYRPPQTPCRVRRPPGQAELPPGTAGGYQEESQRKAQGESPWKVPREVPRENPRKVPSEVLREVPKEVVGRKECLGHVRIVVGTCLDMAASQCIGLCIGPP